MDPFVAEIRIFPFNFAPKGWAFCDGQLLPLSQNTALFSLLGTTYGGDGKSNFALPDMQGNVPMHYGQGPGLSLHDIGETGGAQAVSLIESEIPSHSHVMSVSPNDGTDQQAAGELYAGGVGGIADNHILALHARDGIEGVITGRALYDGRLDLATAISVAEAA